MKPNIKIVGDVGGIKIKELSLEEKLMVKAQPGVAVKEKEKEKSKPDTKQVVRSSPR